MDNLDNLNNALDLLTSNIHDLREVKGNPQVLESLQSRKIQVIETIQALVTKQAEEALAEVDVLLGKTVWGNPDLMTVEETADFYATNPL